MAGAGTSMQMGPCMRVSGRMARCMATVFTPLHLETSTRASGRMANNMARARCQTKTARSTSKALGLTVSSKSEQPQKTLINKDS